MFLHAVVTFYDQKHFNTCFVHDSTGGISVQSAVRQFTLNLGDEVEIRGFSDPGRYAPTIRDADFVVLGHGGFPEPRKTTFEELATGNEDGQWVEVSGIVRSVSEDKPGERLEIEIATGGGRLIARVRDYDPAASYEGLVDARVRIRGNCAQLFNQKRQMFRARLLVPGMEQVLVDEPAAKDPFSLPVRTAVSLMQFAPGGAYGRRVHVRGVVTFWQPGRALYIRDDTQSLIVRTSNNTAVQPGNRVDVIGFPAAGEWTPILEDASYRRTEEPPVTPAPRIITGDEALSGAYDGDLVQIEGVMLEISQHSGETACVVQSRDQVFEALLEQTIPQETLASWEKGSLARLTGICVVAVGDQRKPHAFRILLRSPEDVSVVRRPPWWTLPRLLWSLGAVSLATLAGWIWVAALGYRVREQTGIIREKIQREAAFEERARLAREFHDSLEQQLTGIRLQLDAVKAKFRGSPDEAESYLDTARSLIRHSHADARRSVWDLRADLLEKGDLPSALRQTIAQSNGHGSALPQVIVSGTPRRLAGRVENHLLRIGQEAARNAVKHSQASNVKVELHYERDKVRLRICDNGRGFDPCCAASSESGHFGLLGMRERAEKVGGFLTITSEAGQGTSVEVIIPESVTAAIS